MTLFIASCSKDKATEQDQNNNNNEIKLVTLGDGSKSTVTLLEFVDVAHYEATISSLETQMEQHEDAFLAAWSSLSDDALNAKEVEVGFVDHQPLINFETAYSIPVTLRQIYVALEAQWLNNEELVMESDPALTYPFSAVELTLLNADGMVKIGDDIIQLSKNGFIQIANLDIETVIRIKNGDMTALEEPSVTTSIEGEGGKSKGCTNWASKEDFMPYNNNNKRVKRHVHFHSYPWKGVSEADITSYKKSGSSWNKYKMDLGVANQSYFRDVNCNAGPQEWTGWKRKKAKSISERVANWGAFPQYRAENGVSVIGYFEYDVYSNSLVLTW